jgi:TolB protein
MRGNARKLILACASAVIIILSGVSLICTGRLSNAGSRTVQTNRVEPGNPAPAPGTTLPEININAAAFKGQGRLAFVCGGLLYVLDGQTGTLRRLTTDGIASQPVWSPDGEWLAFLRATGPQAAPAVWLTRRDGAQAHQVPAPAVFDSFSHLSWLGSGDVLEVSGENGVWLVPVTGASRQLAEDPGMVSPDGQTLAYAATTLSDTENRSDTLYTVAVTGGRPVWRLAASQDNRIILAGWWPDGKGLLYWLDPGYSADAMAGGVDLHSLRLGDAAPKLLTSGFDRQGWLSMSPQNNLLMVQGRERLTWADKSLALINVAAGQIREMQNPAGCVSIDPAISADGKRIAFVAANDLGDNVEGFNSNKDLMAWVASRTLWVERADGSGAHPLPSAGQGVYQPLWSRDGSHILYARDNSLWLIGADGGEPARICGPLSYEDPLAGVFGYFGFISYQDEVAWYQP